MLSKELLQELYEDPERFLLRNNRSPKIIKAKQQKIKDLHKMCLSINTELKDVVVYTGPSNKLEECMTEVLSLEEEINEEIQNLVSVQRETTEVINLLDDNTQRLLLDYRYCHDKNWETIAEELEYSYRWTLTLHARALENLKIKAEILIKAR